MKIERYDGSDEHLPFDLSPQDVSNEADRRNPYVDGYQPPAEPNMPAPFEVMLNTSPTIMMPVGIDYLPGLDVENGIVPVDLLTQEPMVFGADLSWANKNGGPLTKTAIEVLLGYPEFTRLYAQVKAGTKQLNIDTRVTQCMEGFLPSIGGWHCDEVPRGRQYSQPDFSQVNTQGHRHFMVLLASVENHSCTEFVHEPFNFNYRGSRKVYTELNEVVQWGLRFNQLTSFRIQPGAFYEFDQLAVHRPTPTVNPGWRFFFRASISDRPNSNSIRRQVQVYGNVGVVGW